MRISDWSSDVCSSDLAWRFCRTPHQKLYPIAERRHCERRKGGRRMSWINRVRKVIPFIAKKETKGDNLWHKCGNCGQLIFLKEWPDNLTVRSEESRVGKECGSTCRHRGSPYH